MALLKLDTFALEAHLPNVAAKTVAMRICSRADEGAQRAEFDSGALSMVGHGGRLRSAAFLCQRSANLLCSATRFAAVGRVPSTKEPTMTIIKFPNQRPHRPFCTQELRPGDELPANVTWLREPRPDNIQRSPEMLLCILLLQTITPDARKVVRHHIRALAAAGDVDAAMLKPLAEAL